tara:strand:+ start:3892 stop:4242 length:351 start_codon:yes stop_codon:yes gene_type:complete
MDRIIQILQKEYDRVEYGMKLGRSIGKENAPEFKQLEKELEETGKAIKILTTNADTGEKQCNLPVVSGSAYICQNVNGEEAIVFADNIAGVFDKLEEICPDSSDVKVAGKSTPHYR